VDDEDWPEMVLEPMEEPDDWSAAFDGIERDEIEEADSAMHRFRHGSPLDDPDF